MKTSKLSFLPAIIWFGITLWLFTMPGSKIPHAKWFETLQVDKWVHITLFFILCLLFIWPMKKMAFTSKQLLPWLLLITVSAILYGVIIELVQRDFVENRSFDIWDIVADSIGSIGAFIWGRKKLGSHIKQIGPDRNRGRNQN